MRFIVFRFYWECKKKSPRSREKKVKHVVKHFLTWFVEKNDFSLIKSNISINYIKSRTIEKLFEYLTKKIFVDKQKRRKEDLDSSEN